MADSFEEIALRQSIIRKQWLPPDVAVQELTAFEKLFGAGHFLLACHAALPSLLTPELLHLIRLNFLDQQQPSTPWIAEMDFLLSPLCRPVENDLFEVEPMVREVLLSKLEERYGWQQLQNVADFLLQYLHKTHKSTRNAGVTQLHEWIAQSYLQPDKIVRELTHLLNESVDTRSSDYQTLPKKLRIARTMELLAEPLRHTTLQEEYAGLVHSAPVLAYTLYSNKETFPTTISATGSAPVNERSSALFPPAVQRWLSTITTSQTANTEDSDEFDEEVEPIVFSESTDASDGVTKIAGNRTLNMFSQTSWIAQDESNLTFNARQRHGTDQQEYGAHQQAHGVYPSHKVLSAMKSCQYCSFPLPKSANFCGMCGHQTSELPITLLPRGTASHEPAYSGKDSPLLMVTCQYCHALLPESANFCGVCGEPLHSNTLIPTAQQESNPWHANLDNIPTQPLLLTAHASHHQPSVEHGTHHQPQGTHVAHLQAVAGHAKPLKKTQHGYRPSNLITAVSPLIVVSVVSAIALLIAFFNLHQAGASNNMTLELTGKAIPGHTVQVVGNHFPPNQTVFITLDDQPLINKGTTLYTWHSSALNLSMVSLSFANSSGTPVTVQPDGTFTVTILIDTNWTVGSTHHLSISNQQGTELKGIDLTVEADQPTPASTPTPTPTLPTPTPTPTSTPVVRIPTAQRTQSRTVNATGQETTQRTTTTVTISIINEDTKSWDL